MSLPSENPRGPGDRPDSPLDRERRGLDPGAHQHRVPRPSDSPDESGEYELATSSESSDKATTPRRRGRGKDRAGSSGKGGASAAPPQTGRTSKKQLLSLPPRRRYVLSAWLALVALLAVAAVPLAIDVQRPAVVDAGEAEALARSAETWRQQSEAGEDQWSLQALVPAYNGRSQLEGTPGTTWMHLLAFHLLPGGPDETSLESLIFAGRMVTLVCGLLTVAGVFWVGMSIGGLRTATLAALVCMAMPVFVYFGRLASPDMPTVALGVLTVASAVWAIRPLKMPGGLLRQGTGWLLCGLLLGMVVLTGGSADLPFIIAPILLIFALYPHRLSHLMGLVAAAIIGALIAVPWALYVHDQDAGVWQSWAGQLVPDYFYDFRALGELLGERLLLLVLALLPWTAWLVAGLLQPFSTSSTGARMRMMLGWVWVVPVALLLLGAPGHGALREMVLLLPAAAVLTGQVVRQYSDLSDEGRHTRIWRWLRWPHALVLMFASVGIALVGHFQDTLILAQWLPHHVTAPMTMWYWIGVGVALVLIVALSMRYVERHHPGRAAVAWCAWSIVAVAALSVPVSRGPMMDTSYAQVGDSINDRAGDAPVYWLGPTHEAAHGAARPTGRSNVISAADPRLLLYSQRALPPVTVEQIQQLRRERGEIFVLSKGDRAPGDAFTRIEIQKGSEHGLALWQAQGAEAGMTNE